VSVLVQAFSGLFASDGVDTEGPLSYKVSSSTVKILTRVHLWNENILLILIALHVVAIALYFVLRHDDLLTPMITGRKAIAGQPIVFANLRRALLLLIISAGAVTGLIVWATR
jgi:cytochrome b